MFQGDLRRMWYEPFRISQPPKFLEVWRRIRRPSLGSDTFCSLFRDLSEKQFYSALQSYKSIGPVSDWSVYHGLLLCDWSAESGVLHDWPAICGKDTKTTTVKTVAMLLVNRRSSCTLIGSQNEFLLPDWFRDWCRALQSHHILGESFQHIYHFLILTSSQAEAVVESWEREKCWCILRGSELCNISMVNFWAVPNLNLLIACVVFPVIH